MQQPNTAAAGTRTMKRTAPAVHVLVERFDFWVCGIGGLVALAAATLAGWLAGAEQAGYGADASPATVWFFTLVSLLVLAFPLFSLRQPSCSLRWDGQTWLLGPPDSVGAEPWLVELDVRLDLGAWMLLQVRSAAPGFPRAFAWLPLQRCGMPLQWHGVRCALFAPGASLPVVGGAGRA